MSGANPHRRHPASSARCWSSRVGFEGTSQGIVVALQPRPKPETRRSRRRGDPINPPVRLMGDFLPMLVVGGSFAFVGAILYGAWNLGRYHGRDEEMPRDLARLEERLARVEHTMMQTTGALDRLEAAHRHTVRLITDSPVSLPRSARTTTPH